MPARRMLWCRVAKCDEVRIHGESVDDGENDCLDIDMGETSLEVHGSISPYRQWHTQQLKGAQQMKVL
jgi:hypothetical protein